MGTCVMKTSQKFILLCLLLALNVFAEPKKVVIFYSSIGMGHKSAAEAIKQNLIAKDSTVSVELKNIRDFMPKWKADFDEWLFWKIVKKAPDTFDRMFRNKMAQQNKRFDFMGSLAGNYSQEQIAQFLETQKPTHIITTHYGSAEAMIKLRSQGQFKDIPVGWLHTDYFKGYFPRISQNIDMTFLGIDALATEWAKHGLDETKVATTGLPINMQIFEEFTENDRQRFMTENNLDPAIKTIVLMSGGEGVGDFPTIVESVVRKISDPLQFVVICGKNQEHFKNLNELKNKLPANINLTVLGFTKNDQVIKYIKSSDLYITKSGGLSPTEGFAINKPIVLLDVYGGHERENANLFEKLGLAVVNRDQRSIGRDVADLLANESKQTSMLEKQSEFKQKYNLDKITEFVLVDKNTDKSKALMPLGIENGKSVKNFEQSLAALDRDFPADVEIILSYGKSATGQRFQGDTNPFGHVAMKIDGIVYTLNGRAKHGVEKELVHKTVLSKYLFGVDRFVENMEHTDAFGNSYARDNISIKVGGITLSEKQRMLQYIAEIDQKFLAGTAGYHKKQFNCADLIKNIFASAGYIIPKHKGPTLPLDVLSDLKDIFESSSRFKTEMIHYAYVPNSDSEYKPLRFPLSPHQTTRTFKALVNPAILDPYEKLIGKRVAVGLDDNVYYDNVSGISQAENDSLVEDSQKKLSHYLKFFENYEKQLDILDNYIKQYKFDSEQIQKDLSIISKEYTIDELTFVIQNKIDEKTFPDVEKRERALKLEVGFKKWELLQSKYQSKMDIFIQREMDYLIIGTQTMIKVLHDDLKLRFPAKNLKEITDQFEKAQIDFTTYMKNRDEIGKPLDGPNRTLPFRIFFGSAKSVIDGYNRLTGKSYTEQVEVVTWKTKAKRLFGFVGGLVKLSPAVIKLTFHVFSKDRSSQGNTPLSSSISEAFKKLGKEFNIKTKISGLENIKSLLQQNPVGTKTVNIITPNHSHPMYDAILMSELGLSHHLLVMATDQIVSKRIADRMDKDSSIITVGRGADLPIEKIINDLERGVSNNIMIYPEGSIASGIYDTRPAREKFSHGLIKALVEKGYKVNILPVSYKNASRFLNENSISEFFKKAIHSGADGIGTALEATVNPPIPHEVTESIVKSGQFNLLNTYLRQHWLEELGTVPKTIGGLLKSEQLIKKFDEQFKMNLKNLKVNLNQCYRFYN